MKIAIKNLLIKIRDFFYLGILRPDHERAIFGLFYDIHCICYIFIHIYFEIYFHQSSMTILISLCSVFKIFLCLIFQTDGILLSNTGV